MTANRLRLTDFRNYTEQEIEFESGINVIYGDNAQGKTNILEAVHMFSLGKSNRTSKDNELIRHGCQASKISMDFSSYGSDNRLDIVLSRTHRKSVLYNEIPIKRNSELLGKFAVVYFGPELLNLVKEGPKERRKNLDMLICQLRPNYLSSLSSLRRVVESKNALIKTENPNMTLLGILDEKLIEHSAEVIVYRAEFVNKIAEIARGIQLDISGGKEELGLKYRSCVGVLEADVLPDKEAIKEKMRKKIAEAEPSEIEHGITVISPLREDVIYEINGISARNYASQGQQKTIALVQKLSEVRLIEQEINETPVLLLDDIMSELDRKRRRFVLKNIEDMQIIITCTDLDEFAESMGGGREIGRIYVENGAVFNRSERSEMGGA